MKPLRSPFSFLRNCLVSRNPRRRNTRRVGLNLDSLEARDVPATTNLIANPSVETASGTTPASWATDQWGTNSVAFSYPTTGLDGPRSVRVDVASISSGDAKWVFNDVPVTPGQKYTFSDLYTSDVLTSATIQYKLANGTLSYVGYYEAPASATSKALTFNFTAPANAVSATVLHT